MQDKVTQELFPVSGTTHYRIYAHPLSLLPSNDGQTGNNEEHINTRGDVLDVVTGIFEDYSKYSTQSKNNTIEFLNFGMPEIFTINTLKSNKEGSTMALYF